MADDAGKTEKPTAKRLREARKEGNFARTPDAATWAGVAAGAALLPHTLRGLGDRFTELLAAVPEVAADPRPERALAVLSGVPWTVLQVIAPFALVTSGAAVLASAAQGVHPSSKALRPKFSRLNPSHGVKRMFGPRAAWEGLKSLIKVTVVALAVWSTGSTMVTQLVGVGALPLMATVARTVDGVMVLLWTAIGAGVVLAAADYGYQRHTVMKKLRMSVREIREEAKQSEGDPMMKSAIRSKQMAISRNRMLSAVASADVVLVNPTHIAVALKYEPSRGAPRVVASGTGALARRIRERAQEHRVPVVEDKPLARLLHRICDVGDEIPVELYEAIARILAFVMTSGRPSPADRARRLPHSPTLPDLPSKPVMRARRTRQGRQDRQERQEANRDRALGSPG